jgi:ATP-binding cassette subfamily F protein 3
LNLNLNLVHSSGNIVLRAHHLRVGYKGGPLPGNGSHDSSLPGNELANDNSRGDGKGRKAGRGNGAAAKASQGKDLQGNILHGKILPDNLLFTIDELELKRGERAALIGPNGSGKTTFLKTLLGQVAPLGGQLHLGASLRIGYLAQAHAAMNPENSVLDELLQHKEMPAGKARSHLAHYLFRGEDVFKPVSALSGGERSRLALAILALQGANFLLLDEPTNHLDIPAQEALQEVLEHFPGTILLVSHDRYLVDQLATQIWELHDGQMQVFKGTYREFVLARASATAQNRQLILPSRPQVRDNSKATRQLQQALDRIEARIREQERAVQRLNRELQAAGKAQAFERMHQLSWKYAQAQAELEQLTADWEKMVQ